MLNFLEKIFEMLGQSPERVVLREARADGAREVTGRELLERIARVRSYLRRAGAQAGDRAALLGPNSIDWVTMNFALMAEGVVVAPLYARQAQAELAGILKDCSPKFLFCSDGELARGIAEAWPGGLRSVLFAEAMAEEAGASGVADGPVARQDSDLVTIIYTSGTSGDAKGVCLTVGNLGHMTGCTTERLNQLMGETSRPERVFHYLPFNFAGSWILMLSCFLRESELTLSTDLTRLAEEIRLAEPDYFLNVPTLLERVRRGVEENLAKRGAVARKIYAKPRDAWQRQHTGRGGTFDGVWLDLGRLLIFSRIRARFGPNVRAMICGSAPLAPETQEFFLMLGIPVLQVYGLTETTGICTMDDPRNPPEAGFVGPAIPGVEMRVGENDEILARGPNIFAGYWQRPGETALALADGWFHTGDQGEVNLRGNWRIVGRIKNLIILNSGHNIAPEPLEDRLLAALPGAQQVVLVGNGRGYLCALLTGDVKVEAARAAAEKLNCELPHYRQIRGFRILREAFTAENGLLTAYGKLRRAAINEKFAAEIAAMYDAGELQSPARETANRQTA